MRFVPRVRTKPTIKEWSDALSTVWEEVVVTPAEPTLEMLAVLWAQFALETGRGASCFNNNLGNIKAQAAWSGDYCVLHTFEFVNRKRIEIDDNFRSFPTLIDGARDYLTFLSRPSYREPFACILQGDPLAFAKALKAKGYYTAAVADYARGLIALSAEFLTLMRLEEENTLPSGKEPGLELGDQGALHSDVDRLERIREEMEDQDQENIPTDPQKKLV